MKKKNKIVYQNDIDKLLSDKLMGMWNMERRDYYKLEEKRPDIFSGRGDKNGIMYLGDVDGSHYMDINLLKTGVVKMRFRWDDDNIIAMNSSQFDKDINTIVSLFLDSIDDYMKLIRSFNDLRNGIIPINMRRNMKLNNILENESL